jgi:hypothetical protein
MFKLFYAEQVRNLVTSDDGGLQANSFFLFSHALDLL